MAAKSKPWTEAEQRACIKAYHAMLYRECTHSVNKAAVNRWLRGESKDSDHHVIAEAFKENPYWPVSANGALAKRSRGSLEMKMMNISAARAELGLPQINGYKPLGNIQTSLKLMVADEAGLNGRD